MQLWLNINNTNRFRTFIINYKHDFFLIITTDWKKGEVTKETVFSVNDENGNAIAYQEKPIAYYPDGSTKWSSNFKRFGDWMGRVGR